MFPSNKIQVNGWDIDILQYAVDNCNADSGSISDCLAADGSQHFDLFTNSESAMCTLPAFVDEQVTGVLDALPGCNNLTWGPEEATPQSCDDTAVITDAVLSKYFTDVTASLNWEYVGCGFDDVSSRTMDGTSESNANMTVQTCIKFCDDAGYSYAGLEYAEQ